MADVPTTGLSCPKRFTVAGFEDGAVLLDLETGAFYRLNPAAAQVCTALARGDSPAEAARSLALSFGITLETAAQDVDAVVAALQAGVAVRRDNPIRFREDANGLVLEWNGQAFWHVNHDGLALTYLADPSETVVDPVTQLLWVAPHLLWLRGGTVLHASAVQDASGVLAFCGSTGRGKSTLARMLGEAGRELVADDLLVIHLAPGSAAVARYGEAVIRDWAATHASQLAAGASVPTEALVQAALAGPYLPLAAVIFPGRNAAVGPRIGHRTLGRAEALVQLLENSFAELGLRDLWQRLWDCHCDIARHVPAYTAEVPEGLEMLRQATAYYSLSVKS